MSSEDHLVKPPTGESFERGTQSCEIFGVIHRLIKLSLNLVSAPFYQRYSRKGLMMMQCWQPAIFMACLALTSQSPVQAGCERYFHFANLAPRADSGTATASKRLPNAYAKAQSHFDQIRELEKSGQSQNDLYEVLPAPVPLDYLTELYAQSYPRGKEGGALWHIRPRPGAFEIVKRDGAAWTELRTEYNAKTHFIFDFLHRRVQHFDRLGEIWTCRESPELFNTLKREWNEQVPVKYQIELGLKTTGADPQLRMARLRADHVVGVASPHDSVPYIATAGGVPSLAHPLLISDPATGRIAQNSSLAVHDWREIDSALWISQPIVARMTYVSEIWLHAHSMLKASKELTLATDSKSLQTTQQFLDFAATSGHGNPHADVAGRGFSKEGAKWWRLAEVGIYENQRSYHSFNHVLSLLLSHPEGIKPGDTFPEFGPIAESEFNMHLRGLGLAAGTPKLNPSPLVQRTYNSAEFRGPLTLRRALDHIINGEIKRLQSFAESVPDVWVRKSIVQQLENWGMAVDEAGLDSLVKELEARQHEMGGGLQMYMRGYARSP